MALLYYTGFESGEGDNGWTFTAGVSVAASAARTGGHGLHLEDNGSSRLASREVEVDSAGAEIILGFASFTDLLDTETFAGIESGDTGTSWVNFRSTTAGALEVHRGSTVSATTTFLASAASVFVDQTWQYIEIKHLPANTGGTVIVKVDGFEVLNFSGDTLNSGSAGSATRTVAFRASTNNGDTLVDDLYICDDSGSAQNDFLGDVQIERLSPTGDDTATFVGSDADSIDNYLLVDEVPPDGADYVESDTVANDDRYTLADRTLTGDIIAVKATAKALKDDANPRGLKLIVESGATTDTSADKPLAESSQTFEHILVDDPDTAAAWTTSAVNALVGGFEVGS